MVRPGPGSQRRIDMRHRTRARRIALALAAVTVLGIGSISVFFLIGGPFGFVNDLANGTIGVLSALLAAALLPSRPARLETLAAAAALVGAVVMLLGSALIVFGITGYYLAASVSSLGAALVGGWVAFSNRRHPPSDWQPTGVRRLGAAAGIVMLLGVFALPGVVAGIDDAANAPWFVLPAQVGWLGTYLLYPAWCLRIAGTLKPST